MTTIDLEATYRGYINCLNRQDWDHLSRFVHDDVERNGQRLRVEGYRAMLEKDYEQIPDLRFEIELLVVQPPRIACRLRFDVTPKGSFLDLPVNGRKVTFWENVFYAFQDGKIRDVRSVIDKAAIEAQLR
jgi:predicted ester cyclase